MSLLTNDRLLRALAREPVDRTPVWIMRQAGRYLPEYRATRAKAGSFLGLATNPELACEVTLQPLARFPLDAAILFSDILMIPNGDGRRPRVRGGRGAAYRAPGHELPPTSMPCRCPIRRGSCASSWIRWRSSGANSRDARRSSASRVRPGRSRPTWSRAAAAATSRRPRRWLYGDPKALHRLLAKLARATTDYLNAQIAAGAQAVMIFDTWGGALSTPAYLEFSLAYMEQIAADLIREREGRQVPVILFTKGGGAWLERMSITGVDALGIDWMTELAGARRAVSDRVALQGNMDPGVLFSPPAAIRGEVARILESYGRGPGHVFNLGHGIQPGVNPDHVAAMVAAVQELSPAYHL